MKKKIYLAIILIIVIIIGATILKISSNKNDYQIEEIEECQYYAYRENSQYGIINKEGETIVQAKYTNIIIPNPEKDIFICYNGEKTEVRNSKNEEIFTEYEKVEPIKLKNVVSTLSYEKSVLKYKKEGLYGLIDFNGKIITKNTYNAIENLQPTEGKFIVTKDGKYGVIDLKGKQIIEPKYDQIISDGYYTENSKYKKSGFVVANKTEEGYRYGYINYEGKKILDEKFNDIERISKEDKNIYLIASENGQYGLYKNSKKTIPHEYQSITSEDEEIVILNKNKKYGVATLNGKIIIDVDKEKVETKGIYIYASTPNDKTVYDKNGKVIDINYDRSIYETENENYRISTLRNNNITYYGIIDKDGKQLVEEKYRYIEYIFKDYFIATDEEGNLGIINSKDQKMLEMKYSTLQKIKGKNIIQAVSSETNITEIYSEDLEKTLSAEKPTINTQEDYIVVIANDEETYIDKSGKKIQNTANLKSINYPDEIKQYQKIQTSIENVYYVKK